MVSVDVNVEEQDLPEAVEDADGDGEIIELGEEESDECAPKRVAPDPGSPTDEEREDHRIDHLPYRCWCEHCVMGRGVGEQHRRGPDCKLPVISFDYLLITKSGVFTKGEFTENELKDDDVLLKLLVVKDSMSKWIGAHVVSVKGVGADRYAAEKLRADVAWLGYREIIVRSDNEPAIVALLKDLVRSLNVSAVDRVAVAHPPPYDSKSSGGIENAVKLVQGLLRTLKLCLQSRIAKRVPLMHPVVAWLVRHVAWSLTVRSRGDDGRTAYERLRGKPFSKRMVGFGETVLCKLGGGGPAHDPDGKLRARWCRGVFLGYDRLTNEYVCHSQGRIFKTRTLQRLSSDRRWSPQAIEEVKTSPYALYQKPKPEVFFREDPSVVEQAQADKKKHVKVRDLNLRRADFEGPKGHGYTATGCPRCRWAIDFTWDAETTLSHSLECRQRMRKLIMESGPEGKKRVEAADARMNEYLAKQVEDAVQGEGESAAVRPDGEAEATDAIEIPPFDDITAEAEAEDEAALTPGREPDSDPLQDIFGDASDGAPVPAYTPTSPGDMQMDDLDAQVLPVARSAHANAARRPRSRDEEFLLKMTRDLGGDEKFVLSELYSPPRVTAAAARLKNLGIAPGLALDLTTVDENGVAWDFDIAERRAEARRRIDQEDPMFVIGTPMCTKFCSWQRLNDQVRPPDVVRREYYQAVMHLRFMAEIYHDQMRRGRYFLHEHPATATSWDEECMQEVMEAEHVDSVVGDRCMYGQEARDGSPVRKATKWMSNSPWVLKALSTRCAGRGGACSREQGGEHVTVSGAEARRSQEFPFQLCKAILKGFRKQLIDDGRLILGVTGLQRAEEDLSILQLERIIRRVFPAAGDAELLKVNDGEEYRDGLTGQLLDPKLVQAARRKELEYFVAKQVWVKVPRSEALRFQGKPPITVKWIDVNKGDDQTPNYRSRLVAREVRQPWETAIFSPTPPLESLRSILSLAATDIPGVLEHDRRPTSRRRTQVSVVDIARAYFNAKVDEDKPVFVDLPREDEDRDKGLCGKLLAHMYGTQPAAKGWHTEFSTFMCGLGFVQGLASACVFHHPQRQLYTSVYGDDFLTAGPAEELDWFKSAMLEKYELTENARLGPAPEDGKVAKILNRIVRWTDSGIEIEADPRQAEKLVRDLGLDGANAVNTPGVKLTKEQLEGDKELEHGKQSPFRAVAARCNYLAADRPDLQFAAKEVCRWMASPTVSSLNALKRVGRYLEGRRRLVYRFAWQSVSCVDVYTDTDWAGCARTRKSTSGGGLVLGQHLVKSRSSTQSEVALSSGEAEYYGAVKASGVGLGFQSLLNDFGIKLPLRVWTDSTATIGICSRDGLGKLRHIDTKCLWLQHKVRSGRLEIRKVKGTENPADVFTKHLSNSGTVEALLKLFGCELRGGRPEGAPALRPGDGTELGSALNAVVQRCYTKGLDGDAQKLLGGDDEVNGDGEADSYPQENLFTEQDGTLFPAVHWDGELVPEAWSYKQTKLPHQLGAIMQSIFPMAKVARGAGDQDYERETCELELHGQALGQGLAR